MPVTRMTFGDASRAHRRSFPDHLALIDGDMRLTWPQFDDRTTMLADALRRAGVGVGDRIMWLGQNSGRVYELLSAAAKIGAMVCPGTGDGHPPRWPSPSKTSLRPS